MINTFIADVHLGKLARLLRMFGFDAAYQNNYTAHQLIQIAQTENRILLSRSFSMTKKMESKCLIIINEDPLAQLKQVIGHFNLEDQLHPFSRCIICNGILQTAAKENILHFLEKNTSEYFNEFWQCNHCKRIYWKGSHYERMLKTIESIAS